MNTHPGRSTHLVETSAFDAWHLLSQTDVARIAWVGPRGVSILPVNCVVAEGALWFRTTSAAAIVQAGADLEVTVEADHLDPVQRTGWSVVMRAVVELVEPDAAPPEVGELVVWPEGPRNVYVRLEPTEVTGRKLMARAWS